MDERSEERFESCTNDPGMVFLKLFIMILPYSIRFTQCLRQRRDHFIRLNMLELKEKKEKEIIHEHNDVVYNNNITTTVVTNSSNNNDRRNSTSKKAVILQPVDIETPIDSSTSITPTEHYESDDNNNNEEEEDVYEYNNNEFSNDINNFDNNNEFSNDNNEFSNDNNNSPYSNNSSSGDNNFTTTIDSDVENKIHFSTINAIETSLKRKNSHEYKDNGLDSTLLQPQYYTTSSNNTSNNYGFHDDDIIVELEEAVNPLQSQYNQQKRKEKKSTKHHHNNTTTTTSTTTNNNNNDYIELSTCTNINSTNTTKTLHHRRPSFRRTFEDGLAMTKRIKIGLQTTLSRSEQSDLPIPPVLARIVSNLPHAYNTIFVWPYSYNALRYFLSILVIIFSVYPPENPLNPSYQGWFYMLYIISTLYNIYWDIINDFNLLQSNTIHPFLREKLLYDDGMVWFYYVVLVVNPILRFLWLLNFTPYGGQVFLMLFEIMRRSLWACIRMELGYIQELARRK